MKKFKELVASDFANVDPHKFDQWKTAVFRAKINTVILIVALILLNVLLIVIAGSLALGGLLLYLFVFLVWSKARRLQEELGIDDAAIKRAKTIVSTLSPMLARVSIRKRRVLPTLGGSLLLLLGLFFVVWAAGITISVAEYGWENAMEFWYITVPVFVIGCGMVVLGVRLLRGRVTQCYQCLACGKDILERGSSCPGCSTNFDQDEKP